MTPETAAPAPEGLGRIFIGITEAGTARIVRIIVGMAVRKAAERISIADRRKAVNPAKAGVGSKFPVVPWTKRAKRLPVVSM
jgi:hypothetical protein